jgi:hypothetical protein
LALLAASAVAPGGAHAQSFEIQPLPPDQQSPAYGWAPAPPQRRRVPATVASLYLGVPLWNDVPREIVRPGFELVGRFGYDLGYIVPELEFGWRWIWVDLDEAARQNPDAAIDRRGTETLDSFWFSLGLRLQVPNDSPVTPFASAHFAFDWWNFLETGYACGWWYCSTVNVYRFTPGFDFRFGLEVEVRPMLQVEAGLGVGFAFRGSFFDDNQSWLSPFLGLTYRR